MTSLWIDPTFGASGDMLLGAFAGLHGSITPLEQLESLDVSGYQLHESQETRCGLSCSRITVTAETSPARTWSSIDALLAGSSLPSRVVAGSRATFRLLGEVEAAQHAVTIDEVHFHEVGAVDAIVDIVGSWLLLDAINPSSITVGPVGLGHGTVEAAHGTLPLPAPATVALLRGKPVRGLDVVGETCTPTGAALLVSMADAWGPLPDGTIVGTARGAGGRNPNTHPNALTVIATALSEVSGGETAIIIEANLDDVTPEVLGRTISQLLAAGADDAWIVPIVMKKGRPANELRVLCAPDRAASLRAVLVAETGSLGCRTRTVTKFPQPRSMATIELRGHPIRMKIGPHGAKPEHDDLVALSDESDVPVRLLAQEALLAFERSRPDQT